MMALNVSVILTVVDRVYNLMYISVLILYRKYFISDE